MQIQTTRRQWGAALAASAVPMFAQVSAGREASSDEALEAEAFVRRQVEQVHSFALPEGTEPAFMFKP